jgi:hypothetical protein
MLLAEGAGELDRDCGNIDRPKGCFKRWLIILVEQSWRL